MDQYIYKTFKMLQNGLYWSFYCCSSIWIFIQICQDTRFPSLHNFTRARERLPEPVSNGQTISKRSPPTHQHTRSRPPPHMGELHLSVPLGDKRNQMKVGSFSRHSTVQPLKKNNKKARKKRMCGREANRGLW